MKKNEFSNLYFLNREIESIKKRIGDINYKIKFVNKYTPEEKNEFLKEEKMLSEMLLIKQKESITEHKKLEDIIEKIPSSRLRLIFAYRYINGLTFKQIAFSIGDCDESDVRKKHNAYLDEIKNKCIFS
ncbi:MAG: hypothetical protein E7404_05690 [Ruminococcaceae bacterium]|nr:hypothetical protein [Oscillospiraceae bacterium]